MRPPLGDVVVRARGLANHLLGDDALRRLARSAGSGVLAGALQSVGYWPAPSAGGGATSTLEIIDASIEHESARRLGVLARWLGERKPIFTGVYEYEERRALRHHVRRLFAADHGDRGAPGVAPGTGFWPRPLREELGAATDVPALIRALRHAGSPYADPLEATRRRAERPDRHALECALDRTFAERSLRAARGLGGRLLDWVRDGIDLENAWDALAGGGGEFVAGGRRLERAEHAKVAGLATEAARRERLAQRFAGHGLAEVFDDPERPLATLESRARSVRIEQERHATRIDPLGAAPILALVMQLRAERAELRRINWGVAQGRPPEAIIDQIARRP